MDLNAVLVQQILVVHDGGNVDAQRNGVQLAIDLAGVQNGLADVGDVQRAVLHIGGQVNQQPIGNILLQVRVVHLYNIRQRVSGRGSGQLVPVIAPLSKLSVKADAVGFAVGIQHLLGALVAGLVAPPGYGHGAGSGGGFRCRGSSRIGRGGGGSGLARGGRGAAARCKGQCHCACHRSSDKLLIHGHSPFVWLFAGFLCGAAGMQWFLFSRTFVSVSYYSGKPPPWE